MSKTERSADTLRAEGLIILNANKPEGAIGLILAQFHIDKSEGDSYGYQVKNQVVLGWTMYEKANFKELRNACKNCVIPELAAYSTANDIENKEPTTPGNLGWFLGENKFSGWIVRKVLFTDAKPLESFALTAGSPNGYLVPVIEQKPLKFDKDGTVNISPNVETETVEKVSYEGTGVIKIADYKTLKGKIMAVVYGDTKPIKTLMQDNGGMPNKYLIIDGKQQFGYLFRAERKEYITGLLQNLK